MSLAQVRLVGGNTCPGPFPFPTPEAYRQWASSEQKLPGITVPFLAINSEDDPIVARFPYEKAVKNPWVVFVTTKRGGHLGWFEGPLFGRKGIPPHRWIKKPVLEVCMFNILRRR